MEWMENNSGRRLPCVKRLGSFSKSSSLHWSRIRSDPKFQETEEKRMGQCLPTLANPHWSRSRCGPTFPETVVLAVVYAEWINVLVRMRFGFMYDMTRLRESGDGIISTYNNDRLMNCGVCCLRICLGFVFVFHVFRWATTLWC